MSDLGRKAYAYDWLDGDGCNLRVNVSPKWAGGDGSIWR